MLNLGFNFNLRPTSNPSFLQGRVGSVIVNQNEVGSIGEVHPQVIENWKLENPVTAMELDLSQLFTSKKSSAGEASQQPTSERAN